MAARRANDQHCGTVEKSFFDAVLVPLALSVAPDA
jgi:hypothetical protein